MKRTCQSSLGTLLGIALCVALTLGFAVVPALTQANLVRRIEAAQGIPMTQDQTGTWRPLTSGFMDNLRHSITRVDLEMDGTEYGNLRRLLPLLHQIPGLEEFHLPGWMDDGTVSKNTQNLELVNVKRIYDVPYPS